MISKRIFNTYISNYRLFILLKPSIISLVLLLFSIGMVEAQVPVYEWANSLHSGAKEIAYDVVADPVTNDVYIVGEWKNSLSAFFPAGSEPSTDFNTPYGGIDGFVAKYDSDGNFIWAFKVGGEHDDNIDAISIDPSGNIYITGILDQDPNPAYFSGTSAVTGSSTLTNTDKKDFFIAKYDPDGKFLWVKRSETDSEDLTGLDLHATSSGVYATGTYKSSCSFGLLSISETFGGEDLFLIKYDSDGNELWLIYGGSNQDDFANGVTADESNVYVSGNFKGDSLKLYNTIGGAVSVLDNTVSSKEDGFIFSYAGIGTFNWSRQISGNEEIEVYDIVMDSDSIYITGGAEGPLNFPSFAGNPVTTTSNGDIFISSHSKINGNAGWGYSIPCTDGGSEYGRSITTDFSGNILFTGYFKQEISFPGAVTLSSAGAEDVFVASFSNIGTFRWALNPGSSGKDLGYGISAGPTGSIYIGGSYDKEMFLDLLSLPDDGGDNSFIAKLQEPCTSAIGGTVTSSVTEICIGESATLTLTGYSGDIKWQTSPSGMDTWSDIPGETSASAIVSPVIDTDYRTYLTFGSCDPDSSNILTIDVYEVPAADAGVGGEICGNVFGLQATPSVGTPQWSKKSGPGSLSFSPADNNPIAIATASLYGTYEITWTETNGTCSDDSTITVVFTEAPASYAGPDAEICISDGSYTLSGSTSANGAILWSTSGDGSFDDPLADNPTYTPGTETGSVTLTKTVTSPGNCADATDFMVLTLTPEPASYAGTDAEICITTGSYTIAGSTSANGTILWSTGGDGSFDDPLADNPTYTPGTETGSVTLTKTVTGPGSCVDAVDFMVLTLTPVATSYAGPDAEICISDGSYSISGSTSANGAILWSTGGDGSFDDPLADSPTYTPGTETGSVILTKTVTSTGSCFDAVDFMVLTLTPQPIADAGTGGDECDLDFQLLASPGIGDGEWIKTSGPGNAIFSPNSVTSDAVVTVDQFGIYQFRWTEINGPCSDNASVSVTFYQPPNSTASVGGNVCGASFNLQAVPSVGAGEWTKLSGPGSVNFESGANSAVTIVTVDTYGNYEFRWTETNGICSDNTAVNVTFFEEVDADLGVGADICGLSYNLIAISGVGTGFWQKVAGSGNVLFEPLATSHNVTVTVDEYDIYMFQWIVSNGPCTDSDIIEIGFYRQYLSDAGPDQLLDFVFSTYMAATVQTGVSGRWEVVEGTGSFDNVNDPLSFVSGLSLGKNIFNWIIESPVCEEASDMVEIVVNDIERPTIITPNNDGLNDFLIFPGVDLISGCELLIYNRWGTELYRTNDYKNDWNGMDQKDRELQNDTYYYILKMPSDRLIKGFVEIRK